MRGQAAPSCQALEAFWDLERWLDSNASKTMGLDGVERECERQGRELLRRLLQAHIDARGSGDVGAALRVATDQGPLVYAHKRTHSRRLVTLFGVIQVTRTGYGRRGRASIHPLDAQLRLPARCYSYELQRRLARTAVHAPFDDAVGIVAHMTGVAIPKRSAEQIVVDAAVDFDAFYAQRAPSADGLHGDAVLVAAIDGKGIPMVKPEPAAKTARRRKGEKRNKKKMATVGCVFSQPPQPRTPADVVASLFAATAPPQDQDHKATRRSRRGRAEHKRVWASLLSDKDSSSPTSAARCAVATPTSATPGWSSPTANAPCNSASA